MCGPGYRDSLTTEVQQLKNLALSVEALRIIDS